MKKEKNIYQLLYIMKHQSHETKRRFRKRKKKLTMEMN